MPFLHQPPARSYVAHRTLRPTLRTHRMTKRHIYTLIGLTMISTDVGAT